MKLQQVSNKILALIFPKRCICCESLVKNGEYLCDKCKGLIPLRDCSLCAICGQKQNLCNCQFSFDDVISPTFYAANGKTAMLNFKFKGSKNAADYYCDIICDNFLKMYNPKDFDAIIYVPSTNKKIRTRGFNQAKWLAKRISQSLEIPILHNTLIRTKTSKTQHNLNYHERQANAQNSYILKNPPNKNSNIILVDDIITTGSTLDAISSKLKEKGVNKIICLVGASTKLK
ncbi:MAG: phosphoribosyltransferase family protein [Oscillospiraceae bacterium]